MAMYWSHPVKRVERRVRVEVRVVTMGDRRQKEDLATQSGAVCPRKIAGVRRSKVARLEK